jgi:[ribosomal protein S18]-alanine N-acetyltransferase
MTCDGDLSCPAALECHQLTAAWARPLFEFLRALEESGDDRWFRPHAFTEPVVDSLSAEREDLYYVMVEGGVVIGYGLLRGWRQGFQIPSLGIAISSSARSQGIGRAFMHFLHAAARRRGSTKVRLRVHEENAAAVAMYKSLGYRFGSSEGPYLVGFFDLVAH